MTLPKTSLHDPKWEDYIFELKEEDEAPSLRDLPLSFIDEDAQPSDQEGEKVETVFDFEFRSLSSEAYSRQDSDICAADEVFFQGQILPLRHPLISHADAAGIKLETQVDRGSWNRLSHGASCSSTVSRRKHNLVHQNPTPNPEGKGYGRVRGYRNQDQKSSVWGLFRAGLVRAPSIEMQNLNIHSRRRNKDLSTSKKEKKQRLFERRTSGILGACSCGDETVPYVIVGRRVGKNCKEEKMKGTKI